MVSLYRQLFLILSWLYMSSAFSESFKNRIYQEPIDWFMCAECYFSSVYCPIEIFGFSIPSLPPFRLRLIPINRIEMTYRDVIFCNLFENKMILSVEMPPIPSASLSRREDGIQCTRLKCECENRVKMLNNR